MRRDAADDERHGDRSGPGEHRSRGDLSHGVTPVPLADISAALSWRGWPYAVRDRAARELRNYPGIERLLKRVLGKSLSREEN